MTNAIQKVEVVTPVKLSELLGRLLAALLISCTHTLFVWWCFAVFAPHLGLTWWGLILPVHTVRMFFFAGRFMPRAVTIA